MDDALLGQLMALLSAVSFAISNVFISQGARTNRNSDSSVIFSVFVTMVFSLLVWLVLENGQIPVASATDMKLGIIWFSIAGFSALVLGRTLIYNSITTIGVIRASAVRRLNPLFSAILAFIILGETINSIGLFGMILVGGAVGAVIVQPFISGAAKNDLSRRLPMTAYGWGIGAALAYSVSYLFRKVGLWTIPAPAFGTLISAVVGFLCYVILALIFKRYRNALLGMFSSLNIYLVAAGIFMSIGQLLQFAALFYERIAVVAMIASMEMFFSTFFAMAVGEERRPQKSTIFAGIVATLGVVIMAFSSELMQP